MTTAAFLEDRLTSTKTFDAVILSVPAMNNHDEDLAPMSRVALVRVGVGVVVKEGGPSGLVSKCRPTVMGKRVVIDIQVMS